jgi:pimeloyl-ACP methyl ester carboxylesterase
MPHADINGFSMHYQRHGDAGEPLVLVHGYTGDIGDWAPQIDEFSKTHRVLVMDHRGHGASSAPSDRSTYTITQMAADIEAITAHAGFERYHLVGHSMGGCVAQEIALRRPERLLSVTFHDTSHKFGTVRDERVRAWYEKRLRLAEEEGMEAVANMPSRLPPAPHAPAYRAAYEKQRMTNMTVDGFVGAWNALQTWEGSTDRLAKITVPALVICGELDQGLLPAAKTIADRVPGALLEIIPEAAHSPQIERPELFNAILRAHLERNAG